MPKRTFPVSDIAVSRIYDEKFGDQRRWSQYVEVVFQADDDGKLYRVTEDRGLTEYQDSYYPDAYKLLPDEIEVIDAVEVYQSSELVVKTIYVEV